MFPELIIAVGLAFEKYGLAYVPKGGTEPMLDPETLWRIPADINVASPSPTHPENQAAGRRSSQRASSR
jgi:hypothetical protein